MSNLNLKDKDIKVAVFAGALLVPFMFIFAGLFILYDAVIFMWIWNLLVPKVSNIPKLTLAVSLVLNLLVSYFRISDRKGKRDLDWKSMLISRPLMLLIAWIISLFI